MVKNAEGKVVKQLQEGDEVAAGEPILYLDDRVLRLNRDKAKSAIDGAGQEVAQAQIALNLAADALTRLQANQKKDPSLVPEYQMKAALGAEQDARSKLLSAQLRQDQARNELDALETQLSLYTLKAPIKGRLGRVQAAVGQTLASGADVAEIVNIEDQIDVLCFVSQRDAAGLRVGQPANLGGFDQRPGEVRTTDLGGAVAFVSDKAELESGCFVVKVRFPNKHPHLRGNVVQRVRVQTREGEQQPSIREQWLIEDRDPQRGRRGRYKNEEEPGRQGRRDGDRAALGALISVRDRENRLVGLRGLVDADGKAYPGDLKDVPFVTQGAQGLETGDPVRLQPKEKD